MRPFSKFHSSRTILALISAGLLLATLGCGGFRLLNKDQSVLGAHTVAITPCGWKLENKFAGEVKDAATGKVYYKYTCGETIVTIRDEELTVNGRSYGKLANATDSVKVDGSRVLVNGREVPAVADTAQTESGR
jgi:hypothetical protein